MITIYKNNPIPIIWEIYKGTFNALEDFSRALLKVFLVGGSEKNKILLPHDIENGVLKVMMPEGLSEGTYSIEAIWVKNWEPFSKKYLCEKNPHDLHFHHESLMYSRKDYVFSVTEYAEEATGLPHDPKIRIKSTVSSYGYDGLSAYESAVFKGWTTLSENEWVANLTEMNNRVDDAVGEAMDAAAYAKMRGDKAKSAYELACDKGFVGTLEDYLKYLHGLDGVIYYPELVVDRGMHLNLYQYGEPAAEQFSLDKNGHLWLQMRFEDKYNEQKEYNKNIGR